MFIAWRKEDPFTGMIGVFLLFKRSFQTLYSGMGLWIEGAVEGEQEDRRVVQKDDM